MMSTSPSCDSMGVIAIDLQVVFGSPSRACEGSGVCRMLPHTAIVPRTWSCQSRKGKLWRSSKGDIEMVFPLHQFTAEDMERWFSADYFLVEEDFDFPLWLSNALYKVRLQVPAGRYACQKQGNITITFKQDELVSPNWNDRNIARRGA